MADCWSGLRYYMEFLNFASRMCHSILIYAIWYYHYINIGLILAEVDYKLSDL